MIKFIQKFAIQVLSLFKKDYHYKHGILSKNILFAYLSDPFFRIDDIEYMSAHQNRKETLIIADIFRELGISFKCINFQKPFVSTCGFDVIFGLEPYIDKAKSQNPLAKRIYYATGAYVEHQNRVIKERTDEFNRLKGTKVPYYRLVKSHHSSESADKIIQIGSKFTIETYPEHLRSKVRIIRQSCNTFNHLDFIERKRTQVKSNEYVWMGSKGSILKGLDIVLDYFIQHTEKLIHIIGSIDPEIVAYYKPLVDKCSNIIFHGFLNINSKELEDIALRAMFVVMPSASEGTPGAVINMMKLGCIPIVSRYAAFDEINEYGYLIDKFSPESLSETVDHVDSFSESYLKELSDKCFYFANKNWNDSTFRNDMKSALTEFLK